MPKIAGPDLVSQLKGNMEEHYAKVEFDSNGGFKIDIHNVGIQEMLFASALLARTANKMMDAVDMQQAMAAQQVAAIKQNPMRTD